MREVQLRLEWDEVQVQVAGGRIARAFFRCLALCPKRQFATIPHPNRAPEAMEIQRVRKRSDAVVKIALKERADFEFHRLLIKKRTHLECQA